MHGTDYYVCFSSFTFFPMDLTYSIVLFVYLYIIVTFLRWHLTDLCVNRRFAKKMLAIGLFFGLSSQFIVQCFSPDDGYLYYFLGEYSSLPSFDLYRASISNLCNYST